MDEEVSKRRIFLSYSVFLFGIIDVNAVDRKDLYVNIEIVTQVLWGTTIQ